MARSDAQRKATRAWNDANMATRYDRINLLVPKGQKEVIAEAAKRAGESISQYMLKAAQNRMQGEQD